MTEAQKIETDQLMPAMLLFIRDEKSYQLQMVKESKHLLRGYRRMLQMYYSHNVFCTTYSRAPST